DMTFDGGAGTDTIDTNVPGGYSVTLDLRRFPTVENLSVGPTAYGPVIGNDLNNRITLANANLNTTVRGGNGNDTILGGSASETIFGEAGNDSLDGGAGNDSLDGGAGADVMKGGAGRDIVDYAARTAKLNISLNNLAD